MLIELSLIKAVKDSNPNNHIPKVNLNVAEILDSHFSSLHKPNGMYKNFGKLSESDFVTAYLVGSTNMSGFVVIIVAIAQILWYEPCYTPLKDEKGCREYIILIKRRTLLIQEGILTYYYIWLHFVFSLSANFSAETSCKMLFVKAKLSFEFKPKKPSELCQMPKS